MLTYMTDCEKIVNSTGLKSDEKIELLKKLRENERKDLLKCSATDSYSMVESRMRRINAIDRFIASVKNVQLGYKHFTK